MRMRSAADLIAAFEEHCGEAAEKRRTDEPPPPPPPPPPPHHLVRPQRLQGIELRAARIAGINAASVAATEQGSPPRSRTRRDRGEVEYRAPSTKPPRDRRDRESDQ